MGRREEKRREEKSRAEINKGERKKERRKKGMRLALSDETDLDRQRWESRKQQASR